MHNPKFAKILAFIFCALLFLSSIIPVIMHFTEPITDIHTVETVPDIPEGEPIMREDPTEPPTEPPVIMGTVNTDRLNVRKEPDINARVFRQMAVGTRVEILERKILDGVEWGRVEDGWINLRYVDIDGSEKKGVDISVNLEDLHNLALVNYMEAGEDNCCNLCRARICDIVLNRVSDERWADSIADVLMEYRQFSYLWSGLEWPKRADELWEQHAIERAYMVAEDVLMGNHTDVYQQGYVWYQGINRTDDYIVCYDCGIYFSR